MEFWILKDEEVWLKEHAQKDACLWRCRKTNDIIRFTKVRHAVRYERERGVTFVENDVMYPTCHECHEHLVAVHAKDGTPIDQDAITKMT